MPLLDVDLNRCMGWLRGEVVDASIGDELVEDTSSELAAVIVQLDEAMAALRQRASKEMTPDGPQRRFGDVMVAALHTAYNTVADHYYNLGYMDEDQRKAVGKSIGAALDALREAMPQELQNMKVE